MMSSSDGRGAAGKAPVAVEPGIRATAVTQAQRGPGDSSKAASAEASKLVSSSGSGRPEAGSRESDSGEQADPWFGVGPRSAADAGSTDAVHETGRGDDPAMQRYDEPEFDPEATRIDWFLPGGRAALLPESMSVSVDEAESEQPERQHLAPAEAAGAPPWAAEPAGSAGGTPPPWENGPWPGPGAARPTRPRAAASDRLAQPAAGQDDSAGPWTPRTVVITGLLPLVVPGLVVGLLGLRRSRSGERARRASVLALAASAAWAVVIAVLVATSSGGSPGGCSYPAAVHKAYATAMADLSSGAPAATQATDLGLAASQANSAGAAAGQIGVRTALITMAGDLQLARTDVIAKRPIPDTLRAHLVADGAALTASCSA
jgi:hypothetical protein